jgi:hypothetical protein
MISRLRPKFTRQLAIGPYFADFACRQAKLIVELDGGQHAESEHDKRRDAFLAQEGWTIFRVWNNELDGNSDGSSRLSASSRRVPRRHPPCRKLNRPQNGPISDIPSLPGRGELGAAAMNEANACFRAIADISFSRHTGRMRTMFASMALALLLGCSAKQSESGWEYRPAHGAYAASLYYRFGDGEGTTLIGSCEGEPSFMIAGGRWQAPEFILTVDDRSWKLPTSQGEHGHYLPVEPHIPNQAIASAKQRIVFQAGNWRREIRPGASLTSFVRDCS